MRKNIISILLLSSTLIYSQSIDDFKNSFINNIKSPQVTDFMRYGNIPIKKYIGELDLNIPLLSVPTQDGNNIDISLTYNASGFIPSKKSGIVGFNWNLMAGGVISREIRGEADDQLGSPQSLGGIHGHFEHGFIAGIRQFGNNLGDLPTENDLLNYNNSKVRANIDTPNSLYEIRYRGFPNDNTTPFETTPDIFNFNFNGISGKFSMAANGSIDVVSNDSHKLKIDLTGMSSQPYTAICYPKYESEIRITDEKGNKYYFGGESKNLEYSVFMGTSANGEGNDTQNPIINSWYLKKIEFQNGEILKYNYADDKIDISNLGVAFCYPNNSPFWHGNSLAETKKFIEINNHVNSYAKLTDSDILSVGYSTSVINASYSSGYGNTFSLVKKTYLANIEYKNIKVVFNYSDQDNIYTNTSSFSSRYKIFKQKKLDNILVKYNDNLTNKIDFSYTIPNSQYPRILLSTVTEMGKSPYVLNYDISNAHNTPLPYTCAIDYWGYYNGKLSNDPYFSFPKLTPNVNYHNNGEFEYITDVREPDFNFSKMYALQSIKYPTGGSSIFEYEPHSYTKRLERRAVSTFLPSLFEVNGIAGGTRIKKIYEQDSGTNQNVREFSYINDNNQGSGILMDWPRYYFYMTSQTSFSYCPSPLTIFNHTICTGGGGEIHTNQKIGYIQSTSFSKNLFEGAVINYSKVVENKLGRGSIEDYYTSYINKPDIFFNNIRQLTDGVYTPMPAVQNINFLPNDRSIERGKLSKRLIKNQNNILLEETSILYNEDPERFNKFRVSIDLSSAWVNTLKSYYYNDFISSSITKKYLDNKVLQTESKYYYENPNNNMLTRIYTNFANESVQETFYRYAHEKGNQLMISKNMIGIPLEKESTQTIGNITKTLSKIETIYPIGLPTSQTGNLVLPLSIKSYDIQNPTVSSTEATYDKYDSKGNLLQYTTKDSISTVIIWGYNGTLPIAKITGATYAQVSSLASAILTASDTDAAAAANNDETSLLSLLDNFRKESALANYQITTYTYDPLIGVRSITPPSGIREAYLYDTANRLKEIRQDNAAGKIIKEFKYNYKQ
ncbi:MULTISPECIES: hypothetical protein [unclassified Chryseobacterium]|uniref:hypothetical protein n=1 Tax=unclassified Chryseobacterium TaxID=2593645 RepID=UPI00135C4717|nr:MULTISPECIES: hypothetical protein [unclassified Chryseobacterium]MCD0455718.1 hypothetical protein [Chryseobacterium sp. LC2016-27]